MKPKASWVRWLGIILVAGFFSFHVLRLLGVVHIVVAGWALPDWWAALGATVSGIELLLLLSAA